MSILHKIAVSSRIQLNNYYEKYHQHSGLLWYSDMAGLCAIGTYMLVENFQEIGLSAQFCLSKNEQHCFAFVENKIVDITATQFGHKPIMIVKPKKRNLPHWQMGRSTHDLSEVHNWLKDWPDFQQPKVLNLFTAVGV